MSERRIWMGREGHFRAEVQALLGLLAEVDGCSLALRTDPAPGFAWILDPPQDPAAGEGGFITLYTSGTTGEPKPVRRNWREALRQKKGRGGPGDRWLLTYSPARWAGLSVIAHGLRHGCQLVVPETLSTEDLARGLARSTHVSLTPSLFRKLLISGFGLEAPDLVQVTFGGEAAPQACLDQARRLWPRARISHVYASTELGDLASASDGLEGFPHLPGELAEDGELLVAGTSTGDLWERVGARYLFRGRKTEIINVGGAKVVPYEVERLINAQEGVDECRVFGVPSPLVGSLVCAEYRGTAAPEALARALRGLLPKYAVPRLTKVEAIALTDAGKVGRR